VAYRVHDELNFIVDPKFLHHGRFVYLHGL
jgi:hypothetical protein